MEIHPRHRQAAPSITWREGMVSALEPVSETLIATARQRVEEDRARVQEDMRVELARAHAEAARLLAEARAEGASAAEWIASFQLTAARRLARETVLGARRRVYETLRRDAIEALARRTSTTEGQLLVRQLSSLVDERLGGGASVHRVGPDTVTVEAESGNRRMAIGPALLIDHVLLSMAEEIEGLWA